MKYSTLAAVLMLLPAAVAAQLPGTTVNATPRVRSITRSGDTTIVAYSVLVSSSSPEHLLGFSISVAAAIADVVSPGVDSLWTATNTFEGRQVASWWATNTIAPGDSTPTLVYKAVGLPGMTLGWLTGDGAIKPVGPDSVAPAYSWLGSLSATSSTLVGVYFPALGQPLVSSYLLGQTDAVCAAGWITSSALCTTLHGLATYDYASVQHYGTSLDSARTAGSAVSDPAYWMLNIIQVYALAHTDPPTPPALVAYISADTATSTYTAHASGGTPDYSYYWEWCAIDCGGGGDALRRAPVPRTSLRAHPNTVAHGWNDVGDTTASICWTMSESTLRLTVTDAASVQTVAYYTVPDLEHAC